MVSQFCEGDQGLIYTELEKLFLSLVIRVFCRALGAKSGCKWQL